MILMAIGVEIVSTNTQNPYKPILSTSTPQSKKQIESTTDSSFKLISEDVNFTQYCLLSNNLNEDFYEFLYSIKPQDKDAIISAIKELNNYPFVEYIEFENADIPTIVIKILELNGEYEDKIYDIHYDLLGEIGVFIDFYVKAF